ncbi:uncharacterized protein EHS24_003201 [Apiotrichum porosum]|uniref:Uncharacterized protein n=1 Tax=Apiotrichum porosum TaxID=105984 RepID=A0A427XFE9_9TREE|nr:uncharacterized protein EHS24_003201 [Apiotrichum porosum]RSH77641.1 hypothetical protein EHS24_003201 [Apiotrichum porosum]
MSGQNNDQQQFTIQPHPATTNDPADLARQGESAFAGGSNVFNTPGQNIPTAQVAAALEDPKTRAQLAEEVKKLNS